MTGGLKNGLRCEVTDRMWGKEGDYVVQYNEWNWLKYPIPFKGFQGIRYIDRIPGLKTNLRK